MSRIRRLRLRYLAGSYAGRDVQVRSSRLAIGRSQDNDLVLPEADSPATSGRHAAIAWHDGEWWIEDLGSRNGTFVNGARVERARLRDGDRIGLGGAPLLLCREDGAGPGAGVAALAAGLTLLAGLLTWMLLHREPTFEQAAAAAGDSIYLVVLEREDVLPRGVGTAFVVGDGLLATNAHVAQALERSGAIPPSPGRRALVVRNDSAGEGKVVLGTRLHADFREGSFRDDVALLRLAPGTGLLPLRLADAAALDRLRRGTPVATFGFAAAATDSERPRARLREHVLGDVRDGRYLEFGLGIVPGFSGSPVFTRDGTVVGLVVGGDLRPDEGMTGASWGITVRALAELIAAEPAAGARRP